MKIGLFGGTFDPVHCGHLIIAQFVRDELSLDRIIFVPAGTPPHKQLETASALRYEMLALAIAGTPYFEISDFEITSQSVVYTIETVENFKNKLNLSRDQLFLIIGSDNFVDLPKWKEPDRIAQQCQIVVFPRSPRDWAKAPERFRKQAIYLRHAPLLQISSTQIRQFAKQGRAIRYWVPFAIEDFITSRKLYR